MYFAFSPSACATPLVCSILGRPCARTYKVKGDALIHTLIYLNDVLGYTIQAVYYTYYVIAHNSSGCAPLVVTLRLWFVMTS